MTEFDHLPEIDRPDMVESELIEQMRAAFMSRPRSLQSTIGPSGAGDPCTRAVIYQLAGRREPPDARGGVMICFESHFGSLSREYARRGADVLVEMTNDGYLGKTPVLRQHLANSVFRAVETKRPLLRVTNVGEIGRAHV